VPWARLKLRNQKRRKNMQKLTKILFLFILSCILISPANTQSLLERISFNFSTSYARTGLGDFNLFYADENNKFEDIANLDNETIISQLEVDHWGMDWEAEMLIRLNKYFTLGLGTGFFKRGKASRLVRERDPFPRSSRLWDPDISTHSFLVNGYFTLPISSSVKAYIKGGTGYYSSKLRLLIREDNEYNDFSFWGTERVNIKDSGFGFQGGIGLEFTVTEYIGFYIEGAGRILKLNDWKGSLEYDNSEGAEDLLEGSVWTVEELYRDTNKYYAEGRISEVDPSEIEFDIRNIRKSKLNFSGVGLKVGFILRFGKK